MFIQNVLAVQLRITAKKTQTATFKAKFGVIQHDIVLRRQQLLGLRFKILFSKQRHKRRIFCPTLQN